MGLFFLAQDDGTASTGAELTMRERVNEAMGMMDILHHPNELLDMLAGTPFIWASVSITVGVLCVLNGYRWHRWVVVVLAFCLGWVIGSALHRQFGDTQIVSIAIASLLAIIATPMLKIAVALFGGLTGAFVGANAWTAFAATPSDATWAGAAMGFIALAMASFIFFRLVIVMFTSIGGAAMVVCGLITLLLQNESWEPAVRDSLSSHHLLLPLLVTVAAVGGMVVQTSRNSSEAESE